MTEDVSFDRIRNILGKYHVPGRRRSEDRVPERSLSSTPAEALLGEVLERDFGKMCQEERRKCLRMAEAIATRIKRRSRKRPSLAAAVLVLGLCIAAGILIKSNKLI